MNALFSSHPYEEVAYEITTLENYNQHIGIGMIGELSEPMEDREFLLHIKTKMQLSCIRHSGLLHKKSKKLRYSAAVVLLPFQMPKMPEQTFLLRETLNITSFIKPKNK